MDLFFMYCRHAHTLTHALITWEICGDRRHGSCNMTETCWDVKRSFHSVAEDRCGLVFSHFPLSNWVSCKFLTFCDWITHRWHLENFSTLFLFFLSFLHCSAIPNNSSVLKMQMEILVRLCSTHVLLWVRWFHSIKTGFHPNRNKSSF